jgi:hypothetical protein
MVNPHIKSSALQDVYISPLEYDPGQPSSNLLTVELKKGQTREPEACACASTASTCRPTAATRWRRCRPEVWSRSARCSRRTDGAPAADHPAALSLPLDRRGRIAALSLPGGGAVALRRDQCLGRSDPARRRGTGGAAETPGVPAKLSLDVTRKPLIHWSGSGSTWCSPAGLLGAAQRVRQVRVLDSCLAVASRRQPTAARDLSRAGHIPRAEAVGERARQAGLEDARCAARSDIRRGNHRTSRASLSIGHEARPRVASRGWPIDPGFSR